jgi:hypothetical protein
MPIDCCVHRCGAGFISKSLDERAGVQVDQPRSLRIRWEIGTPLT